MTDISSVSALLFLFAMLLVGLKVLKQGLTVRPGGVEILLW